MKAIVAAERINSVREYYFMTKLKEIAQLNGEGKNIISLGIGSPDMQPSEATIESLCLSARQADANVYQPYTGIPQLRQAFSDWYKKWYQVHLDPLTEIQPLMGSKEGILHISMAFLNPGDKVLIPNPGYPTYTSVSKLIGAETVAYHLHQNKLWQPDFEALESMDLSDVKMMWVNYPNMPTGARASRTLFKKLVDFGNRHGIVIVNDNPYSFILNEERLSIFQIEGSKDCCIEMNSMSKSHNMSGWRMAMVGANGNFIQWILRVKSNIDSGQYKPLQLAAITALNNSKEWHDGVNDEYRKRRRIGEGILRALGCSFDKQQSGMFLWAKVPDLYRNGEHLSDVVLNNARVFITPGFIFGSNGSGYIRVSLCCSCLLLEEALNRIKTNIK